MATSTEQAPIPQCSLIMKGGITSGVIYPKLAFRLSQDYQFRSIGGSSAGAIAAAATAVAELRRLKHGSNEGFDALRDLPTALTQEIGGRPRLLRLFQPVEKTEPLFSVLLAVLDSKQRAKGKGKPAKTVSPAVLWALVRGYRPRALAGVVPGAMLLALSVWLIWELLSPGASQGVLWQTIVLGLIAMLFSLVVLVAGVALAIAFGVKRTLLVDIPHNNFGICSGMGGTAQNPALTTWLHEYLQGMSGQSTPVTFGDLSEHGLSLKMMTTNLTQGRPMAMPWDEKTFFFDPLVWRSYFPSDVLDWMVDHPNQAVDAALAVRAEEAGLVPLPDIVDLPILVGVRMSLSFPLLISAVPLKAVDFAKSAAPFRTNWFTDGGLCANLPVQFFDRPLPSSPTFAIDLQGTSRPITDPASGSYLPQKNTDGLARRWVSWEADDEGGLATFFGSMVKTWKEWVDTEALRLPGYRDRVVTIYTTDDEGGMNLNMDSATVVDLAERGEAAATKLVDKFTGPFGAAPNNGFDNHRWIRLRSALAGMAEWLDLFAEDFVAEAGGSSFTLQEMAERGAEGPLPSYGRGDLKSVGRLAAALRTIAADTNMGGIETGSPKPRARLRLVPDDR